MLRIITSILVFLIISCSEKNQEVPTKQPLLLWFTEVQEPYSKKTCLMRKKKDINPN